MSIKEQIQEISIGQSKIYILNYQSIQAEKYYGDLLEDEIIRIQKYNHPDRCNEFVATRVLCRNLFGTQQIAYNEIGAPYIGDNTLISLSHCKDHVAIAVNNNHSIGLDIETPREKVLSLSHKFMSSNENLEFNKNDHVEITKVWSAKEAMYKLAGRKKIIFKNELHLKKKTNDNWDGRIINPDKDILVNLNIFEHDGLIISINQDKPIEKERNLQSN